MRSSSLGQSGRGLRGTPGLHQLAEVAEAFLSSTKSEPVAPNPMSPIFVAAPGDVSTAEVLAILDRPGSHDLGSAAGVRLARWERDEGFQRASREKALMIWCPRGLEAWSLVASMALGRIGALLKPSRVTVLWHAGAGDHLDIAPTLASRDRVTARTSAAVPGSRVTVHPVGWGREVAVDLANLLSRDLETNSMA